MSLYIRSNTAFTMHEAKLEAATDQELMEVSNEQGLGLSLGEMRQAGFKRYFDRAERTCEKGL